MRSLSKLCQRRAVRSLTTSSLNAFVTDKSYVDGKWVSARSGQTFDGNHISVELSV